MGEQKQYGGVRFSAPDEAALVEYKALSLWAVVSLVLGAFSFLAVFHPLVWIVPLSAVGSAVCSLRSVGRRDAGVTGRRLALAGLALGVLFGTAAPARQITRNWIISSRARAFTTAWLRLVLAGEREAAFEWTLPQSSRQLPGTPLAEYYEDNTDEGEGLQEFFGESPTAVIAAAGPRASLEFEKTVEIVPDGARGEYVVQVFSVRYRQDGRLKQQRARIVVRRSIHAVTRGQGWRVQLVTNPDEAKRT